MRRTPLLLIGAGTCAIAAILMGVFWALNQEPPVPSRRLADGSLLRLEDVTFGTEQRVARRRWWQRILAPVMPQDLQGRAVSSLSTPDSDQLVIHISRVGAPIPSGSNFGHGYGEIYDPHGCRIGDGAEYAYSSS